MAALEVEAEAAAAAATVVAAVLADTVTAFDVVAETARRNVSIERREKK